ncbi:bestrophin family ion channel [Rhodocytophaga aerolata]|uniref:Bestrophin family ion channel n=1 Tax=Rhodocytophaga aerolata TaxID=455078 RepID=A0ABT8RB45_9BACT|nr:bestrophin family ion channel [Rhodocytophaga aerolata]MDO1449330.1 bestrophin family ion channel [Rhodocytophaga aerolata]
MLLKENIPVKYVLGKIKTEVIVVSIYAIVVAVVYNTFHFTRISIPISVPAIMGTILSLLLAFRSNQAYDRWWEARTLWGAIVNDSRTLARQVLAFVEDPYQASEVEYFRERFIKRQVAWAYSLGQSLRKLSPLAGTEQLLTKEELDFARRYTNKPVALLELHADDLRIALKKGWINEYQQVHMEQTLTKLCDAMGGCERIKNTVFPVTYSLYIHFALVLFIALLPFGLIEFFGLAEIPLVIAIVVSLSLIEKMAIHLQDPFENKPTDTPVTSIARTIERDLRQMLKESHLADDSKRMERTEKNSKSEYFIL